ncbi:putative protein bli-3 protein [Lasiodiplodia theobromae]|uniref:Protein bli-3 n=2 Tax=Lasiodiplodia TaxID=66739 RepID=A0A5N5D8P0_9PEZI|nr:Protein bli-3 [Lasiodiplodia theobromae]KAB2574128.1 Protein bli-3 [Lasiodiplodia theobromae]KAF4536265.1 Protein bli-3 [Lasiodiplodia theobromae]KAF9630847.1 putative protein bli-3 protein [Lasiodiplodia theobromae]KAK0658881.1 Protein bli-3 [Lasiodiplodia hormozganensis]
MSTFSNTDTGSKTADPYVAKNLQEPDLKTKVTDLLNFADKQKFCMMTTVMSNGLLASRCMALAGKEANGLDLLFHTNTESGKTNDLANDSDINIAFLSSSGEWASISGKANVETDRAEVKKYYSAGLKAWLGDLGDGTHDGGPDDPRIGIIRVKTVTAQYAISSKTAVGQFVEFAKGVATGETPAINKLRKLDESEVQQWRASPQ